MFEFFKNKEKKRRGPLFIEKDYGLTEPVSYYFYGPRIPELAVGWSFSYYFNRIENNHAKTEELARIGLEADNAKACMAAMFEYLLADELKEFEKSDKIDLKWVNDEVITTSFNTAYSRAKTIAILRVFKSQLNPFSLLNFTYLTPSRSSNNFIEKPVYGNVIEVNADEDYFLIKSGMEGIKKYRISRIMSISELESLPIDWCCLTFTPTEEGAVLRYDDYGPIDEYTPWDSLKRSSLVIDEADLELVKEQLREDFSKPIKGFRQLPTIKAKSRVAKFEIESSCQQ